MAVQTTFTVPTGVKLKRERSVMNTSRKLISVLFLLVLGFAGNAAAVVPNQPPEKKIVIVNNSGKSVFFPMLAAAERALLPKPNPDLWMQAIFVQSGNFPNFAQKDPYPFFATTLVYRAYIDITNKDNTTGLQHDQSVTITVPFWTQLQEVTDNDIGVNTDQFIDWWNAARIYLFEGATALHAAQITDETSPDLKEHSPTPIVPLGGAKVPTCVASGGATCTVTLFSYKIDPPVGIPFQLQEYTFASAEGPPLLPRPANFGKNGDGLEFVNYNVSSLDSVYLPVAMGPLNNPEVPYVGSTQSVTDFRNQLAAFGNNGDNWPIFVPVYFDELSKHPGLPKEPIFNAACSLDAFEQPNEAPEVPKYGLPKVPGTFNMLVESFRDLPPIPPVLTSDPPNFPSTSKCNPSPPPPFSTPKLGTVGQGVLNLWHDCTDTSNNPSMTCIRLREQFNFFQKNYVNTCNQLPDFNSTIQAIYGFVPITFKGCTGGALKDTKGFNDAIGHYCDLQYNYLTGIPDAEIFNPYTQLIS